MNILSEKEVRSYVAPLCRVSPVAVSHGLCISPNTLPPVEEEDAGIIQWED